MVLTATRGALGFLTRLPVGRTERAWQALGDRPAAMLPVGYLVGIIAAFPLVFLPPYTAAIAYPATVVGVTGVAHADGLADLGDAIVTPGTPTDRRGVMTDTVTGVGGTVAIALVLIGLALGAAALATRPLVAVIGISIGAEVGAKLAMVGMAVWGSPAHGGLGDHLLGAPIEQALIAILLTPPAMLLAWPNPAPGIAIIAGVTASALIAVWATRALNGLSGDVFGAANEVARVVGLHAGVVAWMLW